MDCGGGRGRVRGGGHAGGANANGGAPPAHLLCAGRVGQKAEAGLPPVHLRVRGAGEAEPAAARGGPIPKNGRSGGGGGGGGSAPSASGGNRPGRGGGSAPAAARELSRGARHRATPWPWALGAVLAAWRKKEQLEARLIKSLLPEVDVALKIPCQCFCGAPSCWGTSASTPPPPRPARCQLLLLLVFATASCALVTHPRTPHPYPRSELKRGACTLAREERERTRRDRK